VWVLRRCICGNHTFDGLRRISAYIDRMSMAGNPISSQVSLRSKQRLRDVYVAGFQLTVCSDVECVDLRGGSVRHFGKGGFV
jgi:hypothetical protein